MYAAVFSQLTQRTSIHAIDCRRVASAQQPCQPFTVSLIDAPSPQDAARIYSEHGKFAERGLTEPKICKCATR